MSLDPQVLVPLPWHLDPHGGMACFQRRGVPVRPGLTRCTCCGADVVIPYSQARSSAPIVPGP